MKTPVQRLSDELLKNYPIRDLVEGWFFKVDEVSNGVYEVEGIDAWGRKVSRKGTELELDDVLETCANDARDVQSKLDKK